MEKVLSATTIKRYFYNAEGSIAKLTYGTGSDSRAFSQVEYCQTNHLALLELSIPKDSAGNDSHT